ncbi:hypothetical protein AB5J49_08040 [Streptomyces sp. R28]|uniref:Uncharacterized protein n=1 Tax=Streptomyces sp. R28 TaxID=3238628 RepID=A0AB39PRG8_9ACTN
MGKWKFYASDNDDYPSSGPQRTQIRTVTAPDKETARGALISHLNATAGGDWHADAEGE